MTELQERGEDLPIIRTDAIAAAQRQIASDFCFGTEKSLTKR